MPKRRHVKSFSGTTLFLALLISLQLLPTSAETVTLHLRNGDRITGTIVSETTNSIVLDTSWAKGVFIVPSEVSSRQKAITIATNQPPAGVTNKVESIAATVPPGLSPTAGEKKPVESKFAARKSWHGRIDIGMDLGFSEANRQLYYGKAKVTYTPERLPNEEPTISSRFRNTFDYQVNYGKTDEVLSANRMDASSKTDFDIGKKVFIYNLVVLGYDEIRRINYQYEVGPGVGYRLITRSNLVLNTEFGATYQVQELEKDGAEGTVDEMTERFFLRLAEDAKWSINKRLSFDEKVEFFPGIDDLNAYRVRIETNLRYALWDNLSLSLSLLDTYDNQPADDVSKNDLQIRSVIGITF